MTLIGGSMEKNPGRINNMGATDDFVKIAVQDILGKQGPSPEQMYESARRESPALTEFMNIATHDLKHGGAPDPKTRDIDPVKIMENAEELKNAFARSAVYPVKSESTDTKEMLMEEFKDKAGQEAEATLQKLLKGMR